MLIAALALLANLDAGSRVASRTRPVECNALAGERGANVWERAKIPELHRYCELVASASAKLAPGSHLVAEVVRLADQADALVAGRAAPLLLKGRALCQLGRFPEARAALASASGRDDHALDDPAALLAWARALEATGDALGAQLAYRTLLPRAEVLPLSDRGVAYLGAGMLAMSLGPSAVGEAVAVLRQARHASQDLLRVASTFALALALDRSGDADEAAAVLADEGARDAARALADPRVVAALGVSGRKDVHAMVALAMTDSGRRDAARAEWRAYRAENGDAGPWSLHVRVAEARR